MGALSVTVSDRCRNSTRSTTTCRSPSSAVDSRWLPLDPRLGRILLAAADERATSEIAIIVAALGVPDPRDRPADKQTQADQKHAPFRDPKSDFITLLNLWRAYSEQRQQLSRAKLRSWCRDSFLSYIRLSEWHDIHGQILEVLKGELKLPINTQPASYESIHGALLAGLLSNVCQRKEQGEYLGTRGQKVHIHPGSGQFKARPAWIVAAEQVETTRVYARNVARVEPLWIEKAAAHLVRQHHYEPHWERRAGRVVVHERTTLFGLTLQSGRSVPFERVDPKAARELFIRHALVQMDYDSKAPFFVHNLALLKETEYLQQKGRRVDLLADEAQLTPFFDARVPAEVNSAASFEAWRRKAEREQPRLLFLGEQDVAPGDRSTLDPAAFPDSMQAGPVRVKLEYRFDPSHAEDGVTALVPLHLLAQVDGAAFDWLVPGLFEEKVTAMIRTLPKGLRVSFVPVPAFAARALDQLQPGKASLKQQLAAVLTRAAGITVSPDAFRDESLPAHLRLNVAVLDDNERIVDSSRDLSALRLRHGGAAARSFTEMARSAFSQSGSRTWTFGDLPESVDETRDGQRVFGHPALVDEGETVGLQLQATPAQAEATHRRGLTRLFRLALARDLRGLRRDLPVDVAAELTYRRLGAATVERDLREDLLDATMRAVFVDGQPAVRSLATFEARLALQRAKVVAYAQELARAVQQALSALHGISASLTTWPTTAQADVRSQLSRLMPAGFVVSTPAASLRELPRYLKAIAHRREKAAQDPARDQKLMREVEALEAPFWRESAAARPPVESATDPFRWLLEEYRVSLFAQHLKTPVPVSGKRLTDAWRARLESGKIGR